MADKTEAPRLILATNAAEARKAFVHLGPEFETEEAEADTTAFRSDDPDVLAEEYSRRKARAAAEKHPKATVVGVHTIGYHRRDILEPPRKKEHAKLKLQELSGETHQVVTGVTVIHKGKEATETVTTNVTFRELTEEEVDAYLASDKQAPKRTLGYAPTNRRSATFIKSIEGSLHNLISSIPLETVHEMLQEAGTITPEGGQA